MHQNHGHAQAQQRACQRAQRCPCQAFGRHHGQHVAAREPQVGQQAKFLAPRQYLGAEAGGNAEQANGNGHGLQPVGDGKAAVKDAQ